MDAVTQAVEAVTNASLLPRSGSPHQKAGAHLKVKPRTIPPARRRDGEGYRARDCDPETRSRDQGFYPLFVSHDPDRLSRFQQEAQASTALNDPDIVAVHQFVLCPSYWTAARCANCCSSARSQDTGLRPGETDPARTGPRRRTTLIHETAPGVVMGTVGYMAPEQVLGKTLDHHADIFLRLALAVMTTTAIFACLLPAWRASRTDPARVLRD